MMVFANWIVAGLLTHIITFNNSCPIPPISKCYIYLVNYTSNSEHNKCWSQYQIGAFDDAKKYKGYLDSNNCYNNNTQIGKGYVVFKTELEYEDWQKIYHPRGPGVDPYAGYHGVLLKQLEKCMKEVGPGGNSQTNILDNSKYADNWDGKWCSNSFIKCIKCHN